jgi:hypothetical protein
MDSSSCGSLWVISAGVISGCAAFSESSIMQMCIMGVRSRGHGRALMFTPSLTVVGSENAVMEAGVGPHGRTQAVSGNRVVPLVDTVSDQSVIAGADSSSAARRVARRA